MATSDSALHLMILIIDSGTSSWTQSRHSLPQIAATATTNAENMMCSRRYLRYVLPPEASLQQSTCSFQRTFHATARLHDRADTDSTPPPGSNSHVFRDRIDLSKRGLDGYSADGNYMKQRFEQGKINPYRTLLDLIRKQEASAENIRICLRAIRYRVFSKDARDQWKQVLRSLEPPLVKPLLGYIWQNPDMWHTIITDPLAMNMLCHLAVKEGLGPKLVEWARISDHPQFKTATATGVNINVWRGALFRGTINAYIQQHCEGHKLDDALKIFLEAVECHKQITRDLLSEVGSNAAYRRATDAYRPYRKHGSEDRTLESRHTGAATMSLFPAAVELAAALATGKWYLTNPQLFDEFFGYRARLKRKPGPENDFALAQLPLYHPSVPDTNNAVKFLQDLGAANALLHDRAKVALQRFVARLNTVAAAQNNHELASWAAQRHQAIFGCRISIETPFQLIVGGTSSSDQKQVGRTHEPTSKSSILFRKFPVD